MAHGDAGTGGGTGEGDGLLFVGGGGPVVVSVVGHFDEGGLIGGIGHITHREGATGAAGDAFRTGPEAQLQGVNRAIDYRQQHNVAGRTVEAQVVGAVVSVVDAAQHPGVAATGLHPAVGRGIGGVVLEGPGVGHVESAALSAAGDADGLGCLGGRAVGRHAEGVLRIGHEAADGVGGAGYVGGQEHLAVVDVIGGVGVDVVGPCEGDAAVGGNGHGQVGHLDARRQFLEGEVVDIGIPCRSRTVGTQGHIAAVAGVAVQVGCVFGPVGVAFGVHVDGGHGLEGGDVGRVGHHTHGEDGTVVGAAGLGPELQAQAVDAVVAANAGQHHDLVVAVGAGVDGVVPVETARASVAVAA